DKRKAYQNSDAYREYQREYQRLRYHKTKALIKEAQLIKQGIMPQPQSPSPIFLEQPQQEVTLPPNFHQLPLAEKLADNPYQGITLPNLQSLTLSPSIQMPTQQTFVPQSPAPIFYQTPQLPPNFEQLSVAQT